MKGIWPTALCTLEVHMPLKWAGDRSFSWQLRCRRKPSSAQNEDLTERHLADLRTHAVQLGLKEASAPKWFL